MFIIILSGIFLVLHGWVHLLYAGQSMRLFELRPGMCWPDGGWVLAGHAAGGATRLLVGSALVLAALGFIAAGAGLFLSREWWRTAAIGAVVLSTAIFTVFWDGKRPRLADQGGIGVLINLAILALALTG
jgi:hypothetical protein